LLIKSRWEGKNEEREKSEWGGYVVVRKNEREKDNMQ
jgi:hypothetical protein